MDAHEEAEEITEEHINRAWLSPTGAERQKAKDSLVRLVAAAIDYKDAYMKLYGDGEHTAQQVQVIDATEMELVAAVRALTGEEHGDE